MFRKVIVTGVMAAMLSLSATFANAGIIILGKDSKNTNTATSSTSTLVDTGIIILGLTTGIIILGATAPPPPPSDGIIILG